MGRLEKVSPMTRGESMNFQIKAGLAAIAGFLLIVGPLSIGGSRGNLCAQDIDEIKKAEITAQQVELKKNFDPDFLKKDSIAPSKTGFHDPLNVPAKMTPLASKGLLNGIASAGSRIVAVGERGRIVYSDDKGKSWIQSKVPLSEDLTAVYFPTPKQGWIVGHDGVVLHSADGGISWTKQLDGYGACRAMDKYYKAHPVAGSTPEAEKLRGDIQFMINQGPVYPFLDVWFENESVGFIVGAFNLIFRTEDGGKNWEPWYDRTDNPGDLHLYAIRPVGKDLYISGEQGLVLKLDPRTKRFRLLKTPYNGTFFGIIGKPGSLIAFGMRGNIYRSRNDGAKWEKINIDVQSAILGGTLKTDGSIVLVSQEGNVLVSRNGGESFAEVKRASGLGIPAHGAVLTDDSTLVIAGWLGIGVQKIQ